jgi:hypothetical protein
MFFTVDSIKNNPKKVIVFLNEGKVQTEKVQLSPFPYHLLLKRT